jgi:hypothetical protein
MNVQSKPTGTFQQQYNMGGRQLNLPMVKSPEAVIKNLERGGKIVNT